MGRRCCGGDPAGYFQHSFGDAGVIAALLILLVDPFLKARLLREAARDIFHYLLGFDQQPEIRERLKRLVFDTRLFRKNFNGRYKFVPEGDSMRIDLEYDFELVNPTEEAIDFSLKIDFETAENPHLDFLALVSSEWRKWPFPAVFSRAGRNSSMTLGSFNIPRTLRSRQKGDSGRNGRPKSKGSAGIVPESRV